MLIAGGMRRCGDVKNLDFFLAFYEKLGFVLS